MSEIGLKLALQGLTEKIDELTKRIAKLEESFSCPELPPYTVEIPCTPEEIAELKEQLRGKDMTVTLGPFVFDEEGALERVMGAD